MGRCVSTPSNAQIVTYGTLGDDRETCCNCDGSGTVSEPTEDFGEDDVECPDCDGAGYIEAFFAFEDDVIEPFREHLRELFPSASPCSEWLGREDHAVAENCHAYFGISEYCGMVAYWAVPKENENGYANLANRWLDGITSKFEAAFGTMQRVGRFSNGGAIYRAKDGGPVGADNLDGPVVIGGNLCTG